MKENLKTVSRGESQSKFREIGTVENKWKLGEWIYKWRYIAALLILTGCVLFQISGSSIGIWSVFLNETYDRPQKEMTGDLLGKYQTIRSDEWAVNTPMAFSQYYNKTGAFPYFSHTIRGDKTDTFIVYGQPVKSWQIIFRPFQSGYLFLGPSRGLSFFWCARFLALLLVSLEFGMYLTKKKKLLSLTYALLVSCSPLVAWWFAVNGLVEMFIFGQLAILLFVRWMYAGCLWKKLLYTAGIAWCGVSYILLFYPPWQISFGYVYLFLLIGIVLRERRYVVWNRSQVLLSAGVLVLLMAAPLASIFYKSAETIKLVMNTAYPGKRIFTGGGRFKLMDWPMGLFFPNMKPAYVGSNVCEFATFFSFFPTGLVMGIISAVKSKKKDPLLISMLAGTAILLTYCVIGWPKWLARVTMMGMSQGLRAADAIGFFSVLLLIYIATKGVKKAHFIRCVLISTGACALFAGLCLYMNLQYIKMGKTCILFIVMALGMFFFLLAAKRRSYAGLAIYVLVISLVSAVSVNPLHRGNDSIYKSSLTRAIMDVTRADKGKGLWIVENLSFPYQNLPIMVGAPTINSTNVYPDLKRWEKLDKNKKHIKIYNRYAHISMKIEGESSSTPLFASSDPDQVQVTLKPLQLKTLDVSHILTDRDLSGFDRPGIRFDEEARVGRFYIYNVSYH